MNVSLLGPPLGALECASPRCSLNDTCFHNAEMEVQMCNEEPVAESLGKQMNEKSTYWESVLNSYP